MYAVISRPPDTVVSGLIFYHAFFFLSSFFFCPLISELAERKNRVPQKRFACITMLCCIPAETAEEIVIHVCGEHTPEHTQSTTTAVISIASKTTEKTEITTRDKY